MKKTFIIIFLLLFSVRTFASYVLIPMDAESQKNHLKAYGITYWVLNKQLKVKWLLNYRGGSFLLPATEEIQKECQIRGVSFELISDAKKQLHNADEDYKHDSPPTNYGTPLENSGLGPKTAGSGLYMRACGYKK